MPETKEQRAERAAQVRDHYESGLSLAAIARETHWAAETVKVLLVEAGGQVRSHGGKVANPRGEVYGMPLGAARRFQRACLIKHDIATTIRKLPNQRYSVEHDGDSCWCQSENHLDRPQQKRVA